MFRHFLLALGLGTACGPALEARDASDGRTPYTFTFYSENDFYYGGSDRYYTNGIQISILSPELLNFKEAESHAAVELIPSWLGKQVNKMPWMEQDGRTAHVGISLSQYMFTPEDITVSNPSTQDRPYGGWLNTGFSFHTKRARPEKNLAALDSFEFNLGFVGPLSFAEEAQKTWHSIIDADNPEGWDFQLQNEPTLNLFWQRKWSYRNTLYGPLKAEWIPQYGAALGNVHIYGTAGVEARIGYNLPLDFGISHMRGASSPPLPDDSIPEDWSPWGFHLFGGAEGKLIGRNLFLDGNTFRDGRSVPRKDMTGTLKAGMGIRYDHIQFNFTMVWRSKEFKGQPQSSRFGSVSLTFPFAWSK